MTVSVHAQDIHLGETVNMLSKIIKTVADVSIIAIVGLALVSCASGGGSAAPQVQTAVAPAPTQSTPTDQRHEFDTWTKSYTTNLSGYTSSVTHKFDMTDYTTTGLPAATEHLV